MLERGCLSWDNDKLRKKDRRLFYRGEHFQGTLVARELSMYPRQYCLSLQFGPVANIQSSCALWLSLLTVVAWKEFSQHS